jgi:hypothetical protein
MDKAAIETILLATLAQSSLQINSIQFAHTHNINHNTLTGNILSLQSTHTIRATLVTRDTLEITTEGQTCIQQGTPEFNAWRIVGEQGVDKDTLNNALGEQAKFAFAQAMKKKWIKLEQNRVVRVAQQVKDDTQDILQAIAANPDPNSISDEDFKDLRKRKLVNKVYEPFSISHYLVLS